MLFSSICLFAEEKPIVIVIPSYNNESWCEKNLNSVLFQNYSNYRVVYIDDHSSDRTQVKVESFIKRAAKPLHSFSFNEGSSKEILEVTNKFEEEINMNPCFFTLISNEERCGALANQYRAISSCKKDEIVVLLDGDDWLANNNVLKTISDAYSDENVWMTHGSLVEYPSGIQAWCEPIPSYVVSTNSFRNFKCPSHLRTFYAGIFQKIELKDLLFKGDFYPMTSDMAIMYPIIEMCGHRHKFVEEPLYIYNMTNPINDNKVNAELQRFLDRQIRRKRAYRQIDQF